MAMSEDAYRVWLSKRHRDMERSVGPSKHSGNMLGNPRGGMTLREAQAHAKRLGYTIKSKPETGEYVVSRSGARGDANSYFTNDLGDAYQTVLRMSGEQHARAFRPFRD